jgi:hypothetical protein
MNFKREAKIMLLLLISPLVILVIVLAPQYFKQREKAQLVAEKYIAFRASVHSIQLLNQIRGKAIPVHFDPRFALIVDIENTSPNTEIFNSGERIAFAIHSPTKLFHGEDPTGKTYYFSAEKIQKENEVQLTNLRIKSQSQ